LNITFIYIAIIYLSYLITCRDIIKIRSNFSLRDVMSVKTFGKSV